MAIMALPAIPVPGKSRPGGSGGGGLRRESAFAFAARQGMMHLSRLEVPPLSDPITQPAVVLDLPAEPVDKWEREYRAFLRLLPELLRTHRGKYVAVHEEQIVGSGDDKVALALALYRRLGYVPIYVGLVAESPIEKARLPHYRIPEPSVPS
jgi:hypothetical protein